MIMGVDWLIDHSPTWIHWKKKKMRFPMNGKRLVIYGIQDDTTTFIVIPSTKLKGLLRRSAVSHCVELRRIP
jgi:hypothetical protein